MALKRAGMSTVNMRCASDGGTLTVVGNFAQLEMFHGMLLGALRRGACVRDQAAPEARAAVTPRARGGNCPDAAREPHTPSTSGTPFIACLPLDASGGVDASLSVHRHKIRELGRFAVKEEAALASARYLSDFTPDYEELRSSLLGDASGGESRATLSGQRHAQPRRRTSRSVEFLPPPRPPPSWRAASGAAVSERAPT